MASSLPFCIRAPRRRVRRGSTSLMAVGLGFLIASLVIPARAADVGADRPQMPLKAPAAPASFDWTGFYLGGHFGYAAGQSNWTESAVAAPGPGVSGSLNLFQPFDPFTEAGSY